MDYLRNAVEAVNALPPAEREVFRLEFMRISSEWNREGLLEKGQTEIIEELREQGTISQPSSPENPSSVSDFEAWNNPGTIHSEMYLLGDIVAHGGRVWESTHAGLNHWEPGAPGIDYRIWQDVTDDLIDTGEPDDPLEYPEWKPGVIYSEGDVITHNGISYEVTQGHTSQEGWEPPAVPSLFKAI